MYSITLAPENDSPEVLREYAQQFGVKPGWLFLTGKPKDIELLRRNLGFTNSDPVRDADKTQHVGLLRLGNEPYGWWAACPSKSRPNQILKLINWMKPHSKGDGQINM
jgi:protein SCO1/2